MERAIASHLLDLLAAGTKLAGETKSVLCPGYTHLQPAQPIRFGHWVMSHMSPIMRDVQRLLEMIPRADVCPLGCGALAGNAFGVDREALAEDLGFGGGEMGGTCKRRLIGASPSQPALTRLSSPRLAQSAPTPSTPSATGTLWWR